MAPRPPGGRAIPIRIIDYGFGFSISDEVDPNTVFAMQAGGMLETQDSGEDPKGERRIPAAGALADRQGEGDSASTGPAASSHAAAVSHPAEQYPDTAPSTPRSASGSPAVEKGTPIDQVQAELTAVVQEWIDRGVRWPARSLPPTTWLVPRI